MVEKALPPFRQYCGPINRGARMRRKIATGRLQPCAYVELASFGDVEGPNGSGVWR
jgi:hypothetical protein